MKASAKRKKIYRMIAMCIVLMIVLPYPSVFAADTYTVDIANTNMTYTNIDSFSSYSAAYSFFSQQSSRDAVLRNSSGTVIAMKEGMAVTNSHASTLSFVTTYDGGISSYCQNGVVCYYISTDSNMYATISVSGYRGACSASELMLIPGAFTYPRKSSERPKQYEFDCYMREGGDLVHYISLYNSSTGGTDFYGLTLDKAPAFMSEGIRYYSLDGITYYTDPYDAVHERNAVGTHYIYYKYLSFRSKTNYTEAELNSYIAYKNSTYNTSYSSVYLNHASAFINAQNSYGANAVLEIAFADLESGYGKSSIARNKKNIFGINAVDSNAYESADVYSSVADCIAQHAKYTLSRGYFDAYSFIDTSKGTAYYNVSDRYNGWISNYRGDSRYFGTCTGNKAIGLNVKYASDPWHGEKIANRAYLLDKYLGSKDYGKYTIGITTSLTYAYSEPSTGSFALYKYTSKDPNRSGGSLSYGPNGMPMIILGESGDFYMVQSDMPVNSEKRSCNSWDYNFSLSVAYVPKANVKIIYSAGSIPTEQLPQTEVSTSVYTLNSSDKTISGISAKTSVSDFVAAFENGTVKVFSGGNEVSSGYIATGMNVKLYEADGTYSVSYTAAVKGDLSGDGVIAANDSVKLARYLASIDTFSAAQIRAGDISGDGKVAANDSVILARHLAGISLIAD